MTLRLIKQILCYIGIFGSIIYYYEFYHKQEGTNLDRYDRCVDYFLMALSWFTSWHAIRLACELDLYGIALYFVFLVHWLALLLREGYFKQEKKKVMSI